MSYKIPNWRKCTLKVVMITAIVLFAQIARAQSVPWDSGYIPYVGNISLTFVDAERNNRSIPSLVYYPSTAEGTGTPVLQGEEYPVVSFGHGFVLNPNLYVSLYRHLASWGYIVVAPTTETGLLPSHTNFARDLAFVLRDMKRRNSISADFFFGVVDTTSSGVFGHSMGGGCSVLAGSFDSSITAVASLAAANTNPSSISAASSITAPQLYMSGERDSIASYWTQQLPHYNNSKPFKQIINVKGGNHSYFHLLPGLDDLVDNPATISRQEQQRITRRYVTSFFNLFLKNDTASGSFLCGSESENDTTVTNEFRNLSAKVLLQGFFDGNTMTMISDTVSIIARNSSPPFAGISSSKQFLQNDGYGEFSLQGVYPGVTYYFQFDHRNSVETWTSEGGTIVPTIRPLYDLTSFASSAYGSNLTLISGKFCIYGGDVNSDGIVDAEDLAIADNDAFNSATGYLNSDVDGNGFVDASDLSLIDNNSFAFVGSVTPK